MLEIAQWVTWESTLLTQFQNRNWDAWCRIFLIEVLLYLELIQLKYTNTVQVILDQKELS